MLLSHCPGIGAKLVQVSCMYVKRAILLSLHLYQCSCLEGRVNKLHGTVFNMAFSKLYYPKHDTVVYSHIDLHVYVMITACYY